MQVKELLQTRLSNLRKYVYQIEKDPNSVTPGRIVTGHKSKSYNEYYYVSNGTRKYIRHSDNQLIAELLQKQYNNRVLRIAKKQISLIEKFLPYYDENAVLKVYNNLDSVSRKFVKPCEYPIGEKAEKWAGLSFEPNPYPLPSNVFVTSNNEYVRSKSEVIIANCLKQSNIPYKYECPLTMWKGKTIYPDFTIFSMKTGEIYYWEHFGKLDSEEYRNNMFRRLEYYSFLGLYPGKRLIVTFEDYKNQLNTQTVKQYVASFL